MFGKEFKDDETDPMTPAVPKKDVKEFAKNIYRSSETRCN